LYGRYWLSGQDIERHANCYSQKGKLLNLKYQAGLPKKKPERENQYGLFLQARIEAL